MILCLLFFPGGLKKSVKYTGFFFFCQNVISYKGSFKFFEQKGEK